MRANRLGARDSVAAASAAAAAAKCQIRQTEVDCAERHDDSCAVCNLSSFSFFGSSSPISICPLPRRLATSERAAQPAGRLIRLAFRGAGHFLQHSHLETATAKGLAAGFAGLQFVLHQFVITLRLVSTAALSVQLLRGSYLPPRQVTPSAARNLARLPLTAGAASSSGGASGYHLSGKKSLSTTWLYLIVQISRGVPAAGKSRRLRST